MFEAIWRSLTATGRLLVLGATEAWGFWLATIPLVLVLLFIATLLNGIFWRIIEGHLRPKAQRHDAVVRLREIIRDLKADLYDSQRAIERLRHENSELSRLVDVKRSFNRNWNSDATKIVAMRRA